MNKTYLRQMFQHANLGYGYRYIGEIPNDVNISEFVTSRYVELSKEYGASTIVAWSNHYSCAFLYVASTTPNNDISAEFELIDDLVPESAPELEVLEELITNPDTE